MRRQFAASIDMYRKVPVDLLEGTRRGNFLSIFAVIVIATLFILETMAFLKTEMITDLSLDRNKDTRVRVNFNITMMDLPCEYAVVDVVSVLGTEQNVTQHVTKWKVDAQGVRLRYAGRNKKQRDVVLKDESINKTIEELHKSGFGEDALSLDPDTFEIERKRNQFMFVDYYAMWCSHCRDLMPTWEALAEVIHDVAKAKLAQKGETSEHHYDMKDFEAAVKLERPILMAKVDCVKHAVFCRQQGVRSLPTIRLFLDGEPYNVDYHGDRTVIAFTNYLATMEREYLEKEGGLHEADTLVHERSNTTDDHWARKREVMPHWEDEQHPGCEVSGYLLLDRVPGNFHIKAQSISHDMIPTMTNMSHEVHYLTFGEPHMLAAVKRREGYIPNNFIETLQQMNGNVYISQLHEAYHHHLKVITVDFKRDKNRKGRVYQYLPQSQLSHYRADVVPEAKFIYDLSPVAVSYRQSYRKWYDYLTSIMAIVGGTFTVLGMFESSVNAVTSKKRR